MNKKAFTIIELVITMAIVTLLILTALPRYNLFIHKQDQAAQAQQIAECIQNGQQKASSPQSQTLYISALRYTLVALDVTTNGLTCTQSEHTSQLDLTNPSLVSQITNTMSTVVITPSLVICSMHAQKYDGSFINLTQPGSLKLVFDTLSHGKATVVLATDSSGTQNLTAQFNQGINLQFIVSDSPTNCQNTDRQVITLPALGAPITVQ